MTTTKRKPTREQAALAALPPLAENRVFMAVGPNCWGRGQTAQEAIKNAHSNFSKWAGGEWRYILFDAPEGSYVDSIDGSLHWEWDESKGETRPEPAVVLYRHNVKEPK